MNCDVILLAGGFGTRLQQVVADVPKPMADINGKPFLEHLLKYITTYPVHSIVLSVGYKAEVVQNYFGNQFSAHEIKYAIEKTPLGTGGAIALAMQQTNTDNVLVANADSFFKIDLAEMLRRHIAANADVSIALREVNDASRYGTVLFDSENRITSFKEKTGTTQTGFINGGVYIFNKNAFARTENQEAFSIEKDFFEKQCQALNFYAYISDGYFIDIGIPYDYQRAKDEFAKF
jgi:D-glycero-alpha-D-manno-heptose 1-phosphate guanylyltransferase